MYRISITYRNEPGAPFDWGYYMNNHLPLAVGTSRRHSDLNFCDADRPLNADSPHACVCMVHFDNEDTMIDFCNFFVKEHPESEQINNDEHNYTTIAPNMVAGACLKTDINRNSANISHRIKLFFPYLKAERQTREEINGLLKIVLDDLAAADAGMVSTELDYCSSGIVPGSEPDYTMIWALCFNNLDQAERFVETLRSPPVFARLSDLLKVDAEIMLSEVMHFDMALTEPYRVLPGEG